MAFNLLLRIHLSCHKMRNGIPNIIFVTFSVTLYPTPRHALMHACEYYSSLDSLTLEWCKEGRERG